MSSSFQRGDWYEMPLFYDIVFAGGTVAEANFLVGVLEEHGRSGGRKVLEPACGTGRLMVELSRRGFEVSGFDSGEAMLEFADLRLVQERLPGTLSLQRMEDFCLPGDRFDLAHCLLSTFKHLPDEAGARRHLELVRDHLAPGGIYVLGVHLADYGAARPEHERWVGERDGIQVVSNTRTWPADRVTRRERIRNRLTVAIGGAAERYESTWECRTYDHAELSRLVGRIAGLEQVACYDFNHDIATPTHLDAEATEAVLVLRRSPGMPR